MLESFAINCSKIRIKPKKAGNRTLAQNPVLSHHIPRKSDKAATALFFHEAVYRVRDRA